MLSNMEGAYNLAKSIQCDVRMTCGSSECYLSCHARRSMMLSKFYLLWCILMKDFLISIQANYLKVSSNNFKKKHKELESILTEA
jgi:hypothetical protein